MVLGQFNTHLLDGRLHRRRARRAGLAGLALRAAARKIRPLARGRTALGWALGAIGGPRSTASAVVLSLGLGLSVLAAVGQVDRNLRDAITRDLPTRAPSFFFVDIQRDQMPVFSARLDSDTGVTRVDAAPMLRGIISEINGQPAAEVAGDHWVLQGDRGVSYAAALPDRSTLTAGDWWCEGYDGPPGSASPPKRPRRWASLWATRSPSTSSAAT